MKRVLVEYESSRRGRAALLHALSVAREARAELTVVAVATREPVVGCARCRQSSVLWNREMRSLAEEALAEAAALLGPFPGAKFATACGEPKEALADAAIRCDADVIVLPWRKEGRLRRLFSPAVVESLRRAGRWEVVIAPADAPESVEEELIGKQRRHDPAASLERNGPSPDVAASG